MKKEHKTKIEIKYDMMRAEVRMHFVVVVVVVVRRLRLLLLLLLLNIEMTLMAVDDKCSHSHRPPLLYTLYVCMS